ncbi:MAG: glycogen/starch/alpha-glucan phosphorylase [Clostridia bacterium]|nr:glycogen/starch/alpha-glucan phosphorylase [Clostridia bacterium]
MRTLPPKSELKQMLVSKLSRYFGVTPEEASEEQVYKSVILVTKDILTQKRADFKVNVKKQEAKKVYYLCMEFLIGRCLKNNLCNLGIDDAMQDIVSELGFSLDTLYTHEPDPGLGNGGLGRLAACFMDSLTTLDYSATGFSILYEYGFFKQKIIDGDQVELPDVWMPGGDVWLVPRTDKACTVRFGGRVKEIWENDRMHVQYTDYEEVQAVPYDMMTSGADCEAVNSLRLFKARNITNFNMKLFSQGEYVRAMQESNNADVISKVLYPADNHTEGKLLRLSQQYFLVSASLQSIIADHLRAYESLANFSDKVAIHINDTHPALVVPELMRLFVDEHGMTWDDAWATVKATVSYTNHTVMPEALETWNEDLFKLRLPRIFAIICEINRRFCADLWNRYPGDWDRISRMSILNHGSVRMANLSVVGSHTVNGVSRLHSDILKKTIFSDFYHFESHKFTNVTNGIAHRRWLCYANPDLSALLSECIGDCFKKEPERLSDFLKFKDDEAVLSRLHDIKRRNKERFAYYAYQRNGVRLDPDSLFDVQIKRMHEYKRQLLNVLRIISLYHDLKANPNLDIRPQTFIFGAKAAPGYYMAKQIIKLINQISREIEKDPRIREKIRVIFMEDYNVSVAEVLIPAADLSEQISLAGKEASGTSNMKLMINGALTIGTLDGANVEIHEAVGDENCYIFGLTTEEVDDLWKHGYVSANYYNANPKIKDVMDTLTVGFGGQSFAEFSNYLVMGAGVPDPYMCLADFDSYYQAHECAIADYAKQAEWCRKSLVNIASAGIFAADRSIREYAENIWRIQPIHEKNNP